MVSLRRVEAARLREVNVSALRRTRDIIFPPRPSFASLYVRSETRFSGRTGRGSVISFLPPPSPLGKSLELESWPVSRKKAAPHWPLVVIVVDVVKVRRVREAAVLVTGAARAGRSRRMDRMNTESGMDGSRKARVMQE